MENMYVELKNKQQQEVNNFPLGFAFSQEQFREMMEKWGLTEKDKDKILSIGCGGFVQKKDREAMHEMFNRHVKEMQEAIENDTDGNGFIYQMFTYELQNHEYSYTGDYRDTLDVLGFTFEEIERNPKLLHGFSEAEHYCRHSV